MLAFIFGTVFSACTLFCSISFLVVSASSLILPATTANPFPASPAPAASIDAFRLNRLVWLAISFISLLLSLYALIKSENMVSRFLIALHSSDISVTTWVMLVASCAVSSFASASSDTPELRCPNFSIISLSFSLCNLCSSRLFLCNSSTSSFSISATLLL